MIILKYLLKIEKQENLKKQVHVNFHSAVLYAPSQASDHLEKLKLKN